MSNSATANSSIRCYSNRLLPDKVLITYLDAPSSFFKLEASIDTDMAERYTRILFRLFRSVSATANANGVTLNACYFSVRPSDMVIFFVALARVIGTTPEIVEQTDAIREFAQREVDPRNCDVAIRSLDATNINSCLQELFSLFALMDGRVRQQEKVFSIDPIIVIPFMQTLKVILERNTN
jgi:hypothetical protein